LCGRCGSGGRRPTGCLKLQSSFHQRATNYRALLRKMTYKDKASYVSLPPFMQFLGCCGAWVFGFACIGCLHIYWALLRINRACLRIYGALLRGPAEFHDAHVLDDFCNTYKSVMENPCYRITQTHAHTHAHAHTLLPFHCHPCSNTQHT